MSLNVARVFVDRLPQAAALIAPHSGQCLHANNLFIAQMSLGGPTDLLPAGVPWSTPGVFTWRRSDGHISIRVSALPIVEDAEALLVQESPPSLSTPVADALKASFPLGIAWIDRTSDHAVLVNESFWSVWRLPPGRQTDVGAKLRTACRGLALSGEDFDGAWPADRGGDGRFIDVALTDGRTLRLATFNGSPQHRWVVAEDVTEPKQRRLAVHASELREQESQRLESLSVLAGGIAHDFNNLLLVILTNAEILREASDLEAGLQSAVDDIRLAAERASELSAKMLAYSGRGHMNNVQLDFGRTLDAVVQEVEARGHDDVEIRVEPVDGDSAVSGDPNQLRQLFKAVLLNAVESDGTSSVISRCEVRPWTTEELSRLYLGDRLVSGPYVTVTIVDDGEGIDPAALPRIFDPFFSTRGPSRGLGLAAATGIARGHGGTVDVQSVRGQGAKVRVLLPVAHAPPAPTANTVAAHPSGTGGTVLLVDDESLVRRSARQALEQAGFQVVEAENGDDALELFSKQPDRFNLVIMDISMPGPPGDLVAQQIRDMTDPPVPLVLSSGYRPSLDLGEHGVADSFLQKPYRRAELIDTIRRLLSGS